MKSNLMLSEAKFHIDKSLKGWTATILNIPKKGKNHDVWSIKYGSVILADGATPLDDSAPQNVAQWAKTFTDLACVYAKAEEISLSQVWGEAITVNNSLFNREGNKRTAAVSHIRLGKTMLDSLTLGDIKLCFKLSGGTLNTIFDDRVYRVEEKYPKGNLKGEALLKIRKLQKAQANQPGGFYAIADDPTVGSHAISHSLPISTVQSLIISSDGFWRLFDNISSIFEATNFNDVESLLRNDLG